MVVLRLMQACLLVTCCFVLLQVYQFFGDAFRHFIASTPMPGCATTTPALANTYTPRHPSYDGRLLFMEHCGACHKNNSLSGLQGAAARWSSEDMLKRWIRNWPDAVATGDAYAKAVAASSPAAQPNFTHLSEEEMTAIVDYLKTL